MIVENRNVSIGLMILSLIIPVGLYCAQYLSMVSAEIVPFPRQEIKDGIQEGVYLNASSGFQQVPEQRGILDNPQDILGVSYFSDGKILNATLWLSGIARNDPSRFSVRDLEYGVLADIDSRVGTGKFDVDFQKQIKWTNDTNNWTSSLIEYSSSGLHKDVIERRNLTNFKDKFFFPVSIDLNSITSPSKFRAAYYTILTLNDNQKIIDVTSWIDIPPAEFSLSPSTNPLLLTKGETMDIGVQLISNTGTLPRVFNFIPEQNHSRILIQFNPNELNTSSFHVGPAPFRISVPQDVEVGSYIIPVLGNVSVESQRIGVPSINASILGQSYFTIKPNLTITVVNPPSFEDEFKVFWSSYGQVISLFGAGFAGGFSTHIMDRIKQRGKDKRQT